MKRAHQEECPQAQQRAAPAQSARGGVAGRRAAIAALQRRVGNRAVARMFADGPRRDRPVVSSPRLTQPVVQRVNTFWGESKATPKENPLFTIANKLEKDAGVPAATTLAHWRGTAKNLAIAKTAKLALTASTMATYLRPEQMSAWLDTPNPNPGTRKDPSWITAVGNLGTVEDQIVGDTPQKYNGGHLIAWEFLNEKANVPGNIAPQAMLQNQALFRRIERTLEETISKGGTGLEVTVSTPYRHDNTTVTYQQLIDRKVITDKAIVAALGKAQALDMAVPIAQIAPDTYDIYLLTQTGVTHPATADKREQREGVQSFALSGYTDAVANKVLLEKKPPPLSILASNLNPETMQQDAVAFAHLVFLNYRTTASPVENVREQLDDEDLEARRKRALEVIEENMGLAAKILEVLVVQGNMSPTEAEHALVVALMESEPPGEVGMDVEEKS